MIRQGRLMDRTPDVWTHFNLVPTREEEPLYDCKKCALLLPAASLARHLDSCPGSGSSGSGSGTDPLASPTGSTGSVKSKIRHEKFEEMLASLVLRYDLPFNFGESVTFIELLNCYSAGEQEVSRKAYASNFVKMYYKGKENLRSILMAVSGKINFTCDYWVCVNSDEYVCLTAHFIDRDWNLKKIIVNFSIIPLPYEPPKVLLEHVSNLLKQHKIGQNVLSISWDDDFPVDVCDGIFPGVEYIPIRGAGVLNSIVRDVIKHMKGSINKVRQVIRRLSLVTGTKKKFLDCLAYHSLDAVRDLRYDVPKSWYSTLSMLSGAVYYRSPLMRLGTMDDEPYEIFPSKEEWDDLEQIHDLLACVNNFIVKLSAAKHSTSSMFFPGMVSIYMAIKTAVDGDCPFVQGIGSKILEKLNVFWKDFNELMAVAVVFDPRYKFRFVEFAMKKVYGDDDGTVKCMELKEKLYSLFEEYAKENVSPTVHSTTHSLTRKQDSDSSWEDLMKEFGSHQRKRETTTKSQLDKYLDEPIYDTRVDLDILSYWQGNNFLYPQVVAMARDVLSIPISTVVLDGALDIEGKELGEDWCKHPPPIVEVLICSENWLSGEEEIGRSTSKLDELTSNVLEEDPASEDEAGLDTDPKMMDMITSD